MSGTRSVTVVSVLCGLLAIVFSSPSLGADFTSDFDNFWNQINTAYPYFAKKQTDWQCVKRLYRPQAVAAKDRSAFIRVLERSLDELYDPHASLNTNLPSSTRLIPSGLDIWAEWQHEHAMLTAMVMQVRPGSVAEHAGVRVGMEVLGMNGVAIGKAVASRLGRCLRRPDAAARNWALLAVLAGQHDTPRLIEVRRASGIALMRPDDAFGGPPQLPGVTFRRITHSFGYVAIHDLGASASVALFDAALEKLRESPGLIIDLRDTPAGGNSDVAEAIIGRFIDRARDYQRVLPPHRKAWKARALPRGPWTYHGPVVVLVSRWTGSMGEGMAIGFDGMRRGVVVGTKMAGLNGGVFTHHLAQSNIDFTIPGEALAHLNGTPRETFRPTIAVDLTAADTDISQDFILNAGVGALVKLTAGQP